jgi:hypothetical protein
MLQGDGNKRPLEDRFAGRSAAPLNCLVATGLHQGVSGMSTTALPVGRPGAAESGRFLGPVTRIRNWLRGRSRYEAIRARLARLEAAGRQQALAQAHAIEIARALEEKIARIEENALALAPVQARLARLESAWRQQVYLHLHAAAGEDRLAAFEASWRQHVPAFVNAVGTVSAFGHQLARLGKEVQALHNESMATIRSIQDRTEITDKEIKKLSDTSGKYGQEFSDLWHRLEFIRSEILYEIRYGRDANNLNKNKIVPRILSLEKVEAARNAGLLRLNLGCGHIALDDFINIDRRELPGVDIVAEVGNLPFEESSIQEIYSAHLLEHFPQEELRRRLLPYWVSLLRPGGRFRAVVPDGEAMVANLAARTYPFEDFRAVLFGGQDYEGDFHYNLLTPDSLAGLLREAGLVNLEIPARGRLNGQCFEFEIVAQRPATPVTNSVSR